MGKSTFVESGVNLDLRASLAPEAHQRFQRHQYLSVYSRLRKSWSRRGKNAPSYLWDGKSPGNSCCVGERWGENAPSYLWDGIP